MKKVIPFGKKLFLLLSFLFASQLFSQKTVLPPNWLDPVSHPKFVNPLPFPAVMQPTVPGGDHYEVDISQFDQDLGIVDALGTPFMTKVWGYNGSYPGPTIEARSGDGTVNSITVKWNNNLPKDHLFAIDKNIHSVEDDYRMKYGIPDNEDVEFNGIPTITHLHGGHNDADSDGHPESWYSPNSEYTGSNYFPNEGGFYYDNSQEAATLWYHDHTIGITRLNVYAGLAGFYLLRDDHEDGLNLPKDQYQILGDATSEVERFEIPLVIQDRIFDTNGQLFYPSETFIGTDPQNNNAPITLENSILPEMFGDFILVNGKAWPYLDVQPRKYRLRLLNGSDSRFYDLKIPGVDFFQIGTDGGLLHTPLMTNKIVIGPGERIDVIVDFSAPELWGQSLIMRNTARSPYPFGATVNPHTSGQIMAFNVITPLTNPDISEIPTTLRATPFTVPDENLNAIPRQVVLFEQLDQYGRLLPSLGTAEKGALSFLDEITENPAMNSTEIWDIYNTTPDAHPIHLHLVHFQVLSTQKFNVKKSTFGENPPVVKLLGQPAAPSPENAGRKDTFVVLPGEVATVKAFFDKKGEYVWHCHILSHEDHDMMRPLYVGPIPDSYYEKLALTMEKAIIDAGLTLDTPEGLTLSPNPFMQTTTIRFSFATDLTATVKVYNLMGQEVATPFSGTVKALELYEVSFDRQNLPPGSYICKLTTSDNRSYEQLMIAK